MAFRHNGRLIKTMAVFHGSQSYMHELHQKINCMSRVTRLIVRLGSEPQFCLFGWKLDTSTMWTASTREKHSASAWIKTSVDVSRIERQLACLERPYWSTAGMRMSVSGHWLNEKTLACLGSFMCDISKSLAQTCAWRLTYSNSSVKTRTFPQGIGWFFQDWTDESCLRSHGYCGVTEHLFPLITLYVFVIDIHVGMITT